MQHAIYSEIGDDEEITSIKVTKARMIETAVLNELIGLLAIQRNIFEAGLKELYLDGWESIPEPLDDSVLQLLASKCNTLTKLTVSNLGDYANGVVSLSLANLVAFVLN